MFLQAEIPFDVRLSVRRQAERYQSNYPREVASNDRRANRC
jgi:hypothetical protein